MSITVIGTYRHLLVYRTTALLRLIVFWNKLQMSDLKNYFWNIWLVANHKVQVILFKILCCLYSNLNYSRNFSGTRIFLLPAETSIHINSLPHSLILLHQEFKTLSSFQAAVTEEMLWLLKLCQLPHYGSHNSGKAQTRTTSWTKAYHSLTVLGQLLPLFFQACHCSGCQGKRIY